MSKCKPIGIQSVFVNKNGETCCGGLNVIEPNIKFEIHADGVKEIEECPFCEDDPCNEPHCPYTEK